MSEAQAPIAVFDSGLGGLSVLKSLVSLMPHENYIYFGDSKNAPYGTKEHDTVVSLAEKAAKRLCTRGAKALVIACNTATAVAAEKLRRAYPDIPVIGMEPALKPAVLNRPNSKIIVMATPMTLGEEKFARLYEQYRDMAKITLLACPELVEYVENGVLSGSGLHACLERLFKPLMSPLPDAVVLGCTHYPFVRDEIQKVVGDAVIFDGNDGTARETMRRLELAGLLNRQKNAGYVEITNSLNSPRIAALSRKLFYGEEI